MGSVVLCGPRQLGGNGEDRESVCEKRPGGVGMGGGVWTILSCKLGVVFCILRQNITIYKGQCPIQYYSGKTFVCVVLLVPKCSRCDKSHILPRLLKSLYFPPPALFTPHRCSCVCVLPVSNVLWNFACHYAMRVQGNSLTPISIQQL